MFTRSYKWTSKFSLGRAEVSVPYPEAGMYILSVYNVQDKALEIGNFNVKVSRDDAC